jgi:hypothetical protein
MEERHAPGNGKGKAAKSGKRKLRLEQAVARLWRTRRLGPGGNVDGEAAVGQA